MTNPAPLPAAEKMIQAHTYGRAVYLSRSELQSLFDNGAICDAFLAATGRELSIKPLPCNPEAGKVLQSEFGEMVRKSNEELQKVNSFRKRLADHLQDGTDETLAQLRAASIAIKGIFVRGMCPLTGRMVLGTVTSVALDSGMVRIKQGNDWYDVYGDGITFDSLG